MVAYVWGKANKGTVTTNVNGSSDAPSLEWDLQHIVVPTVGSRFMIVFSEYGTETIFIGLSLTGDLSRRASQRF
jgi:hypothetical protein